MNERKCVAPDDVFAKKYEDVEEKNKIIIIRQNGLGCEGGGVLGNWCDGSQLRKRCYWLKDVPPPK